MMLQDSHGIVLKLLTSPGFMEIRLRMLLYPPSLKIGSESQKSGRPKAMQSPSVSACYTSNDMLEVPDHLEEVRQPLGKRNESQSREGLEEKLCSIAFFELNLLKMWQHKA